MSKVSQSADDRFVLLVEELGLGTRKDVRAVKPLTGGVASDIALIDLGDRRVCAKFALPKLKVKADWRAPVHRNAAEYRWLEFAGTVRPDCVPKLFGRSEALNGFAMEYIGRDEAYLWKEALLDLQPPGAEAEAVGTALGQVHSASAAADFQTAGFQNQRDFGALRVDPYLLQTARVHPAWSQRLTELAEALYKADATLVHGDVSPKNILLRRGIPVFLDAECATMGDPAFDVAFCLNHLVLKSVHLPMRRSQLLAAVKVLWSAYEAEITWEPPETVESRTAVLLPALMLARVDGKSPVEYLDRANRNLVRELAIRLLEEPKCTLDGVVDRLSQRLGA